MVITNWLLLRNIHFLNGDAPFSSYDDFFLSFFSPKWHLPHLTWWVSDKKKGTVSPSRTPGYKFGILVGFHVTQWFSFLCYILCFVCLRSVYWCLILPVFLACPLLTVHLVFSYAYSHQVPRSISHNVLSTDVLFQCGSLTSEDYRKLNYETVRKSHVK